MDEKLRAPHNKPEIPGISDPNQPDAEVGLSASKAKMKESELNHDPPLMLPKLQSLKLKTKSQEKLNHYNTNSMDWKQTSIILKAK